MINTELEITKVTLDDVEISLGIPAPILTVGELVLELPEIFNNASGVVYYTLNDYILLSASTPDNKGVGLWQYSLINKNFTMISKEALGCYTHKSKQFANKILFDDTTLQKQPTIEYNIDTNTAREPDIGKRFDILRLYNYDISAYETIFIDNKYVLTSDYSDGLYLYDDTTEEYIRIFNKKSSTTSYIYQVGDKYLFGSSYHSGVYLYNPKTNEYKQIYSSGAGWGNFNIVNDKCLISSNQDYTTGILSYDITNETIEKIYDVGVTWKVRVNINNKYLLSTESSRYSNTGILLYNYESNSITPIYAVGYGYINMAAVGNKCLISGSSNNEGLLLYNSLDDSIVKLSETSYNWKLTIVNNKILVTSTRSGTGNTGVYIYNPIDDSIILLTENGYSIQTNVIKDRCLMSGYSLGVMVYNSIDDTLVEVYTSMGSSVYFYNKGNNCIITSYSGSAVLLYKYETNEIIPSTSNISGWIHFKEISDKVLIGNNTSQNHGGVKVYDDTTETIITPYSYGAGFNEFIQEGLNCYITGSSQSRILYYNYNDNTIKLLKYKIT